MFNVGDSQRLFTFKTTQLINQLHWPESPSWEANSYYIKTTLHELICTLHEGLNILNMSKRSIHNSIYKLMSVLYNVKQIGHQT
jgi:hypothetical protein